MSGVLPSQPDRPKAPADAYHEMAAILPTTYFFTPPPTTGVRFFVTGNDGVQTTWDVRPEMEKWLRERLAPRRLRVASQHFRPSTR